MSKHSIQNDIEIQQWMTNERTSHHNYLKQWSDLVNKETPPEDFWIETPVGSFKNPSIILEESELENEITFTIKYDEWEQKINKL